MFDDIKIIILTLLINCLSNNVIKCSEKITIVDSCKKNVFSNKEQTLNDEIVVDAISQIESNGTKIQNDTLVNKFESRNFLQNNSDCCLRKTSFCEIKNDCLNVNYTKCVKINNYTSELMNLSDVGQEKSDVTSTTSDDEYKIIDNDSSSLYEDIHNESKGFFSPYNLFKMVPPFALHTTPGVSEECRVQSAIYVKHLKLLKIWALKMYDSFPKIPSGFLNGNVNQYGDMDQCMEVRHRINEKTIKGQYCLASLQLTLANNASNRVKEIYKLIHSHFAFRSKLTDPGHRIPRFSSITWALCVPSTCTAKDVQLTIEHSIEMSPLHGDVSAKILVDPNMCQIDEENGFSTGFKIVSSIFAFFVILATAATIGDLIYKELTPLWLLGFSVIKNMKSILSLKPPSSSDDEVKAVNGIRCLNAIMLLFSHKSMAIFFLPYINRTHMAEALGKTWSVVGRTASIYTDPFIMFSGLLTCYSILGKHKKGQRVSILHEYLCRLFRLLPTMGALMLFCIWILPELSSGPQWPAVVTKHAQICKMTWWRNLLFIHNYFGFENMCLTHTHHVGIDTQLFLLGVPLSLWLVSSGSVLKKKVWILFFIATASTVGRFYISYVKELVNFVSYGCSVEDLFRTADYMYTIPMYRITVYIMGMLLALILRDPPQQRMTQFQLRLGWVIAVSLFLLSFILPAPMSQVGYKYNATSAALYASLAPIAWVLSFGWVIYTQHLGYNSWLGDIFSYRIFAIWTRLSYAIYLTQFPVFFYFVGTTRTPQYYTVLGELIYFREVLFTIVTSLILTLLFDLPFQNIRRIVCRLPKNSSFHKREVERTKQE